MATSLPLDDPQRTTWDELLIGPEADAALWELFHENSKTNRLEPGLPTEQVRAAMSDLWESFPYDGYPSITLPTDYVPLTAGLSEVIQSRKTARGIQTCSLTLAQLATLLYHAYGVNRDNEGTIFPRPFRVVPSGGGLYPLEIFFHSSRVEGLKAGIYHYNPSTNSVCQLQDGDKSRQLSECLVQGNLALDTGIQIFLTGVFERSTFKYGNRGYRFTFLEAGHVAQNLNLVSGALGLGCVNIGGFFDSAVDTLLGLDGISRSAIYLVGIGANGPESFELV